jgi:hypothetical protein
VGLSANLASRVEPITMPILGLVMVSPLVLV